MATTGASEAEKPPVQAHGIDGRVFARAVAELGVSHVITVPDTNLRTLIAALDGEASLRQITVCTEDEAIGINAGLYMAGQRPMLLVQNNGVFACINTLKAIALDAGVPTFFLVGQYGRDVRATIESQRLRAVRLLEPTLATWGVPFYRIEGPGDLPLLTSAYRRALDENGPAAALVGAPTT